MVSIPRWAPPTPEQLKGIDNEKIILNLIMQKGPENES